MKSNMTKCFDSKAKRGLRFADGLVPDGNSTFAGITAGQQAMVNQADQRIASQNQAFDAMQKQQPAGGVTQGEQASISIQSNLNNLGTVNSTPGLGQGAQRNFFNKSLTDLQGGNNQPYTPSTAPNTTAAFGPSGPRNAPTYAPGRTPLRQYQEPEFADGMVPETAEQLSARIAAKYGTSGNTPALQPASQPQPQVQAPAPQPKPQGGLFGGAVGLIRDRAAQAKAAAGYKNGMTPHVGPGIVHGPGGPREDKVDAKLSNDEAVLPAATVEALGGPEAVAELIEATNGKAPARGLRDGVQAAKGVVEYDPLKDPSRAHTPYRPPVEAPRSTEFVQDGVRTGEKIPTRPNFENVSRAVTPYTEVEMPRGEAPRVATQDGVRMGQQSAQGTSRPNWIDPTKQVATVTNQPHISDPGAIEGEFRKVPNTGTSVATVEGQGARTANVDRVTQADYARGMRNGQGAAPATVVEPVAPKGNPYNPNINPAEILKGLSKNKVVQMGGKVAKGALKAAPYVAGAVDASGIVDVATDPNKTKADVATEVARDMGRWGSATAGGAAAAGASLPFAPMAGPFAPAVPVAAGLVGGAAGYFGADKLMDLGSGQLSPSSTSYGAVKKTLGLKDPNLGAAEKTANEAALNGGNGGGVITGMPSKEQLKAQAAAGLRKTQKDLAAWETSADGVKYAGQVKDASGQTAIEAATKAGNIPGQNHIPEAVTIQDQAASGMMGKEVDKMTGVSSTGNGGLRGMAQRMNSYATNEGARQGRNAELQLRGDGTRYEKGADGKLTITNAGDFDGSTKMQYTGTDGKPTAVFAGSMENQRGIADAKGMRRQLANIEQMNLERNAKEDITDAGLRTYSRAKLAQQDAQNAKYNETLLSKRPSQLDLIKDDRDERKFQNDINNVAQMQRNNVRDHKAKQSEYMAKRSQTLLDNLFPTAGLKDDALKSAQQNRSDAEVALYAAAKSMPANDGEFDAAVPAMESQMRLTMAHKKAMQDQGIWQKLRNAGRDPITTLVSMQPKIVGDDFVYENGYKLPTKLVLGNDPALLAAHNARVNAK